MNLKDQLPNFDGHVLSVLCAGEDTSQLIENPTFEKHAGRIFMVGTVPEWASEDNWMVNLPCAIAWDTVQDYVIFDSSADYHERLNRKSKKKKRSCSGAYSCEFVSIRG